MERPNYVYFIVSYETGRMKDIKFSKDYPGIINLNSLFIKEINKSEGQNFQVFLYRFEIFPEQLIEEFRNNGHLITVTVCAQNEKNIVFEKNIALKETHKDQYVYDFIFPEKKENETNFIPPLQLELSHQEQFEIFKGVLRDNRFSQSTVENENLIHSTQEFLAGKVKYDFSFFILILLECYKSKYCLRHLSLFKPEKIKGLGNIDHEKLSEINNILDKIEENPDDIILKYREVGEREKIMKYFYLFRLFFNLIYQKEKVEPMLENERIKNYILEEFPYFKSLANEVTKSKK